MMFLRALDAPLGQQLNDVLFLQTPIPLRLLRIQ